MSLAEIILTFSQKGIPHFRSSEQPFHTLMFSLRLTTFIIIIMMFMAIIEPLSYESDLCVQ